MLLDAFRRDCDTAIVISNDSDLKEPIALAQSELGLHLGVCQFASTLPDARGTIHKPATW